MPDEQVEQRCEHGDLMGAGGPCLDTQDTEQGFTVSSVQLETGRTHQIRVHFAHKRHALVGDPTYGGRLAIPAGATSQLQDTLRAFRRQALHAERLAFRHPTSGETAEFRAPPPDDFEALVQSLERDLEERS